MKERFFLGLDFETQDDKPETTRVTEVGCTLLKLDPVWGFQKVAGLSALCWEPDYPPQTEFIKDLTGITDEMLQSEGLPRAKVFSEQLMPLVEKADVIFAHKTSFDRVIFESTCNVLGLTPPKKEWICTLTEFNWPAKFTCKKLSHLAYEHGIMVDPRTLHRAENDTDLMMNLVTTQYKMEDILAYARAPWIYLKASPLAPWQDGGVQNELAKSLGFSWQTPKGVTFPSFPKYWVYRTKDPQQALAVQEQIAASKSPFRVMRVEGIQ